ncbi:hypothetical protein RRG08_006564 [Elysia crispata]|uniref:Uncharacterized protein n=1 Tax=Elysia crispata TaxID=231223 RepID=A0AAE0Z8E8_9GAST|nr:hypothetical protein RRG08_006564 [Elysia crispata]
MDISRLILHVFYPRNQRCVPDMLMKDLRMYDVPLHFPLSEARHTVVVAAVVEAVAVMVMYGSERSLGVDGVCEG